MRAPRLHSSVVTAPRHLLPLVPLVAALAASLIAPLTPGEGAEPAPARPWTLVYVMAYDNDLARHAAPILEELERGVADTANAVAVLVDDRDAAGMRQIALTRDGRREVPAATDDATSPAALRAFLDWAAAELPARRYAVVFLDHGGGPDQICQDWHPDDTRGPGWLSAGAAGDELRRFRAGGTAPRDVPLVFLQQCGRANTADLFAFRNTAPYVLASQMRMGAPNTYYRALLAWLASHPDADGAAIAETIAAADRHFATLTLVDAAAAAELPERLRPLDDALAARPTHAAPAGLDVCYGGTRLVPETSHDLAAWAAASAAGDARSERAAVALATWIDTRLVRARHRGPLPAADGVDAWCGVARFSSGPIR